jgi:hypothetical protein
MRLREYQYQCKTTDKCSDMSTAQMIQKEQMITEVVTDGNNAQMT